MWGQKICNTLLKSHLLFLVGVVVCSEVVSTTHLCIFYRHVFVIYQVSALYALNFSRYAHLAWHSFPYYTKSSFSTAMCRERFESALCS